MGKTAVSLALAWEEQDVTMSTVHVTVQWGHTVETVPCLAQKDSTEKTVDTPASVRTMADVMPKQVPAVVEEDGKVCIVKNCAAMAHMALTVLRTVSAITMQHATQSTAIVRVHQDGKGKFVTDHVRKADMVRIAERSAIV